MCKLYMVVRQQPAWSAGSPCVTNVVYDVINTWAITSQTRDMRSSLISMLVASSKWVCLFRDRSLIT